MQWLHGLDLPFNSKIKQNENTFEYLGQQTGINIWLNILQTLINNS